MSDTSQRRAIARKRLVWVIIHCEFMPTDAAPCKYPKMDEMVFHVAGSLPAAERYVRASRVSEYSWWKVEQRTVDERNRDADDRPVTSFYNYRGLPRKKPPHAAARRAYDAWQKNEAKGG